MRKVCCAGTRPSWTAASPPQKKGPCRRQNQAGQGHEVDGTGRRSRSSAGSSAGKCLSGRSYACGSHARRSPCPTPARTAPAKARARDRRPRLRLRPAPRATEKAWYRTARALPEEQPASEIRRWPQAAPLSATLDRGANQCLARSIPQIVGPTRTSALHLSRLLLPCLLLDYAEVLFMKHALGNVKPATVRARHPIQCYSFERVALSPVSSSKGFLNRGDAKCQVNTLATS